MNHAENVVDYYSAMLSVPNAERQFNLFVEYAEKEPWRESMNQYVSEFKTMTAL